jgi:hypothetical protein
MPGARGIGTMKIQKIILVILIHILALGISSAEIYKWVDENGVTHYSDSPTGNIPGPTETEYDEIQSADPAPAATPPLPDETQKGTLDSDFFNILDENQEAEVAVNSPTVEIYEIVRRPKIFSAHEESILSPLISKKISRPPTACEHLQTGGRFPMS